MSNPETKPDRLRMGKGGECGRKKMVMRGREKRERFEGATETEVVVSPLSP